MGDWWLPVNEIPNNLPHQATSFIGRERELDGGQGPARHSSRLLTLLGMGGLGKTRLSLQIAAEQIHDFPDGVWFLDLAPISDPALIVSEAAQVLGVREEPDRPLLQTLCAHLKSRRVLLILDNCEHVIKASAQMASAILKAAPHVRHPGVEPRGAARAGRAVLSGAAAARAGARRRHRGAGAIDRGAAVRRPGAAAQARRSRSPSAKRRRWPSWSRGWKASRWRSSSPRRASARSRSPTSTPACKDRYKLLTGGSRVLQERQQTLRALVDWSYELLEPEEQIVLDRLGVFVGGFDLAAAEAVCGMASRSPATTCSTCCSR